MKEIKQVLTFRVPAEAAQKLDRFCAAHGTSRNKVLANLLLESLDLTLGQTDPEVGEIHPSVEHPHPVENNVSV